MDEVSQVFLESCHKNRFLLLKLAFSVKLSLSLSTSSLFWRPLLKMCGIVPLENKILAGTTPKIFWWKCLESLLPLYMYKLERDDFLFSKKYLISLLQLPPINSQGSCHLGSNLNKKKYFNEPDSCHISLIKTCFFSTMFIDDDQTNRK